ncbi:MAG: hypothetical protein IJU23_12255 [Proteobacteria bacterium]|nr:hypothetical protein [Pseudomonadota bacterium]
MGVVNRTIGLPNKLSCISRPRRFGKSYAAQMLCAYYCLGCDSAWLSHDFAYTVPLQWREGRGEAPKKHIHGG